MGEGPDSYEDAVARLEQIIDRLDSGQAGLRETLDLCREAELVTYCAGELDAVGEGLKELRLDELAARPRPPRLRPATPPAEPPPAPPRGRCRGGVARGSRGKAASRASR